MQLPLINEADMAPEETSGMTLERSRNKGGSLQRWARKMGEDELEEFVRERFKPLVAHRSHDAKAHKYRR
jgi:hypothetical protein